MWRCGDVTQTAKASSLMVELKSILLVWIEDASHARHIEIVISAGLN